MGIGFLGLGTMGAAMAAHLVGLDDELVVWNRSAGAADALVARGARRAGSPAEALSPDLSFSMLADDAAALEVLSEEALAGSPGRVHVCMSSLSPEAIDELACRAEAAGLRFVACPVLGRPAVAAAGKLNILAAGSSSGLRDATPALERMGSRVWPLGATPRVAAVVKIAVNYNLIHAIQAIAESTALVEANGLPAPRFAELLSGTLFGGIAYTGYSELIATRSYRPAAFSMALGAKDLRLAVGVAAEAGFELPTAPVLTELFATALRDPELVDDDWAAVAEVTRRRVPPHEGERP